MRLFWVRVHGNRLYFVWLSGFRIFSRISCTLVMIFTVIYFDVLAKKEHVIYLLIYIILFILYLKFLFYLYFLSSMINYSFQRLFVAYLMLLFLKLSWFYLWNLLGLCLFRSGLVIDLCISVYFFVVGCCLLIISNFIIWFPRRQITF